MAQPSQSPTTSREDGRPRASAYVQEILGQPDALRRVIASRTHDDLGVVAARLSRYPRIVLTGMGASLFALHPAWIRLARAGLPAFRLDTAALDQDTPELLTKDTLVIAASQSGRSAEIVALAERIASTGATLIALSNDPASPLAERADVVLDLQAGEERAVSTRSYVNTLAAAALAADTLVGGNSEPELLSATAGIEHYLTIWRDHVTELTATLGLPARLYLVARGAALAAAECGALILKEAAKWPVEAMSAGQFRHGPLELADDRLTTIVISGPDRAEQRRNAALLVDLARLGAHAYVAGPSTDVTHASIPVPVAYGAGLPLAQIIPLQLLSVAIAQQTGIEPGVFRHLEKVTTIE